MMRRAEVVSVQSGCACSRTVLQYAHSTIDNNLYVVIKTGKTMTVRKWIDELEMTGHSTFSLENVVEAFPSLGRQVVQNNLMRLKREKRIVSVYRRFYAIMPMRYKSRGIIPPTYYVPELMRFLNRPYYFSLLTAARVWGASHQAAHVDFVTTQYPALNSSENLNSCIQWCYRYRMPTEFIVERKESDGRVFYSSPELTAVELVQYEQRCGGLSNVATVLSELSSALAFDNLPDAFFACCKGVSFQRLGYILEEIIGAKGVAETVYRQWRRHYTPVSAKLSVSSGKEEFAHSQRWHIDVNDVLEVDDL